MKTQTLPTIQEAYILNENELAVLQSLVNQVVECTGNEFGYMEDVSRIGMSKHTFAGYVSQLVQKGCFDYLASEFGGQYALKEEIITDLK